MNFEIRLIQPEKTFLGFRLGYEKAFIQVCAEKLVDDISFVVAVAITSQGDISKSINEAKRRCEQEIYREIGNKFND